MQRLKRQTFSDELHKLVGSKIFSAKFTKKDGSDRVINCMLGVKKHLRGGERTTKKEEFMIVFDTIKKQYRNINLKTLDWIKFNGQLYTVELQYKGNQLKLTPAENIAELPNQIALIGQSTIQKIQYLCAGLLKISER